MAVNPILAILGVLGFFEIADRLNKSRKEKKVFISFSMRDRGLREMFVGQMKHPDVDYRFKDQSVREPWSKAWKANCRERIQACDAVIILLTRNANEAKGVLWEAKCAVQENKPVCLVYNQNYKPVCLAIELQNIKKIAWTRENITKFLDDLTPI